MQQLHAASTAAAGNPLACEQEVAKLIKQTALIMLTDVTAAASAAAAAGDTSRQASSPHRDARSMLKLIGCDNAQHFVSRLLLGQGGKTQRRNRPDRML